jgi:hypothetical protein
MAKVKYPSTLTIQNMTMASSVAVVDSDFTPIATYKVPAQQQITFGNGSLLPTGAEDRGILRADFNTSGPADISGSLRFIVADSNQYRRNFIRDVRSEEYESTEGVRMGEGGKTGGPQDTPFFYAGRDSLLILEFKADANATIDKSESSLTLPITIKS